MCVQLGFYYQRQGKVMFSEACVILFTVGMGTCIQRGLHLGGLHPGGGGLHPKGEVCIHGMGVCIQEVCIGGIDRPPWICLRREGVSADPLVVTSSGGHCSGRYASYWNAFLFLSWMLTVEFFFELRENIIKWSQYLLPLPGQQEAKLFASLQCVSRSSAHLGKKVLMSINCFTVSVVFHLMKMPLSFSVSVTKTIPIMKKHCKTLQKSPIANILRTHQDTWARYFQAKSMNNV